MYSMYWQEAIILRTKESQLKRLDGIYPAWEINNTLEAEVCWEFEESKIKQRKMKERKVLKWHEEQ